MATSKHRTPVKLADTKILRREDITPELLLMWIEKPHGFTFKAGQYCTLGVGGIERAYSISSAPHELDIELFVELVPPPDGNITPLIWELNEGDTLTIRPRAKGIFTFKPKMQNQLLVATVTGIVPYISFLRDYLYRCQTGHHFYVLQGASYQDEFTYLDELQTLANAHPEIITYVPTVSRPSERQNDGWDGETGRVNNIVEKHIDAFSLSSENTIVYACGHPEMIEDVKDKLVPGGFKVDEERFWKQD